MVEQVSGVILGNLQSSVGLKVSEGDAARHFTESQALLCATLAVRGSVFCTN